MTKLIVLGTVTFLFTTSLAFAANSNIAINNNATQQAPQKSLQLSDNDQPPGWNRGKKQGWYNNQGNHSHHHHHKHHDNDSYHNNDHDDHGHDNH